MAASGDSKTTTVRLSEQTKQRLEKASYILRRSQSQVMEDALNEYFKNHGLIERYVVSISGGHVVLLRLEGEKATVLEVQQANGVSPEKVAEKYAAKLQAPVDLVLEPP